MNMNAKKIFFLLFVALMITAPILSVFAAEYTYEVTVRYRLSVAGTNGYDTIESKTYTVTASSVSEAESQGKSLWEAEKGRWHVFVSVNALRR